MFYEDGIEMRLHILIAMGGGGWIVQGIPIFTATFGFGTIVDMVFEERWDIGLVLFVWDLNVEVHVSHNISELAYFIFDVRIDDNAFEFVFPKDFNQPK